MNATAPRHWLAGLSGGALASTSVVASASSWWASLPPELRGLVGALLAGVLAELVALLRAWLRKRGEQLLDVRVDAPSSEPVAPPPADVAELAARDVDVAREEQSR